MSKLGKYKYYFRQPRSAIAKDILIWLAVAGVVAFAATSPFFITNLMRAHRRWKKYPYKKVTDAFSRFKREGLLDIERQNNQIYVSLTDAGRRKAGWLQINSLEITKQKKWDCRWRIVIFDIADASRIKREALRGFLKRLGFYQLQKSVWACPYNCQSEIELIKDFFGFSTQELRIIEASSIGEDREMRKIFDV